MSSYSDIKVPLAVIYCFCYKYWDTFISSNIQEIDSLPVRIYFESNTQKD